VKKFLTVLTLALSLPLSVYAQRPLPPDRPEGNRRQQLQQQIVQRFMDNVSLQLNLDAATRSKLETQMRASGDRRRELAKSTAQLRRSLMDAVRDSTTPDSEIKRQLTNLNALRDKEEDLWKSDQEALSHILTPRQQARFVFMWLRFNDQVREMALRPPPGAFGGPGRN
jgi:Spy/CpxP family protein refolding chaperone